MGRFILYFEPQLSDGGSAARGADAHGRAAGGGETKTIGYLWELPQNLIGLALSAMLRAAVVERVEAADRLVFRCFRRYGGVSLGRYVFVHLEANRDLVRHELGHCRQSALLGPLYLPVIGLPSMMWAMVYGLLVRRNPALDYFRFFTERWANRIAGLEPPRSGGGPTRRRAP